MRYYNSLGIVYKIVGAETERLPYCLEPNSCFYSSMSRGTLDPVFMVYNNNSEYSSINVNIGDDCHTELIRKMPLINCVSGEINCSGKIRYEENEEFRTDEFKLIKDNTVITTDDRSIALHNITGIQFSEINDDGISCLLYDRTSQIYNSANIESYARDRNIIDGQVDCLIIIGRSKPINMNTPVMVDTNQLHQSARRLIIDIFYDYFRITANDEFHSYACVGYGGRFVTITNECGDTFTIPSFLVRESTSYSFGDCGLTSTNLGDRLRIGTIISRYDKRYVIIGRDARGRYIMSPYDEDFITSKFTDFMDGVPVTEYYNVTSRSGMNAYVFEGFVSSRELEYIMSNYNIESNNCISAIEPNKLSVYAVVTLKTKDELIEEFGYNNTGKEPDTLVRYTETLAKYGGKDLTITGVYGDRYTVALTDSAEDGTIIATDDLEEVLVSIDMIRGGGYKKPTVNNNTSFSDKMILETMNSPITNIVASGCNRYDMTIVSCDIVPRIERVSILNQSDNWIWVFTNTGDAMRYNNATVSAVVTDVAHALEFEKISSASIEGTLVYDGHLNGFAEIDKTYVYGAYSKIS